VTDSVRGEIREILSSEQRAAFDRRQPALLGEERRPPFPDGPQDQEPPPGRRPPGPPGAPPREGSDLGAPGSRGACPPPGDRDSLPGAPPPRPGPR
jgi:hypothetical protein